MPNILVPLYIYPAPGAWDPLHKIIEHRPDLTFTIVINPNNGPSVPGLNGRSDNNYLRELNRLNNYRCYQNRGLLDEDIGNGSFPSRVRLVGYVATTYGRRPFDAVKNDIETYAGWSKLGVLQDHIEDNSSSGNNEGTMACKTAVQGIFFDETPNNYDPDIAAYMGLIHRTVKQTMGLGEAFVVDNPGCIPDARIYDSQQSPSPPTPQCLSPSSVVDLIVIFEDSYAIFKSRLRADTFATLPACFPREKRAFIVHSLPPATPPKSVFSVLNLASTTSGSVNTAAAASSLSTSLARIKSRISPSLVSSPISLSASSSSTSLAQSRHGESEEKGRQGERYDKRLASLGKTLCALADTVYVTDVRRDYYGCFSEQMELLCGPWT